MLRLVEESPWDSSPRDSVASTAADPIEWPVGGFSFQTLGHLNLFRAKKSPNKKPTEWTAWDRDSAVVLLCKFVVWPQIPIVINIYIPGGKSR